MSDDRNPFGGSEFDLDPAKNPFGRPENGAPLPVNHANRLTDIGVTALKGAIGVPEAAIGIGDLLTGGDVGKTAEDLGFRAKEAKEYLNTLYSDKQKAANRAVDEAEGFFPTVGAMLRNPSTIAHAALESAPSMLSGGVLARGVMRAAPALSPIAAGAMGEGAVAAGMNAEQLRQETDDGLLTPRQSAIMAASGALTGSIGLGAGQLANKLGVGELSTMLAAGRLGAVGDDAVAAGAQKGILRKIGEGALVEGVGQELPQSAQEQIAHNLALERPWDEGVAKAGAQGMLAGGLMGGIAGPLQTSAQPAQAAPQAPPQEAPPLVPPAVPPAVDVGPTEPVGLPPAAPAAATDSPLPPAPTPGPLTRAASLATPSLFPFSDMAAAQKQADERTMREGIPYAAGEHPTQLGRFAALPVTIKGDDEFFLKAAERQGIDPATAQLLASADAAEGLFNDLRAYYPEVPPQQWRNDKARANMAATFLMHQQEELAGLLGQDPTPAESYIARQVGLRPAADMLTMSAAERSIPVSSILPDPATEQRLGLAGMSVEEALQTLTSRANATLAAINGNGGEHGNDLGTAVPAADAGVAGEHGGQPLADAGRAGPVAAGPTPAEAGIAGGGQDTAGTPAAGPQRTDSVEDQLYRAAVDVVMKNGTPSVAMVQRHLRIGYNNAARLMERMERDGIVGPMASNGARTMAPDAAARAAQLAAAGAPAATAGDAQPAPVAGLDGHTEAPTTGTAPLLAAAQEAGLKPAAHRGIVAGEDGIVVGQEGDPNGLRAGINRTDDGQYTVSYHGQRFGHDENGSFATLPEAMAAIKAVIAAEQTKAAERTRTQLDTAAQAAATSTQNELAQPSAAQIAAGNYKKGHVTLQGLDISIENPSGSTRSGTDRSGKPWQTTMQAHYGYIKGTRGADKDHIDTFIGPNPDSDQVVVVDQVNPKNGKFDEHKVMLGYDNYVDAQKGYRDHYAAGWQGGKEFSLVSMATFKRWLKEGDTTKAFYGSPIERAHTSERAAEVGRQLREKLVGSQHLKYDSERKTKENTRDLALAKSWGYTDDTVPVVGFHGTVDSVFHDAQPGLQYDNGKKGGKHVKLEVRVAQAPNGKWAVAISMEEGYSGHGSAPSIHGKQYDSRDDAVRAGVEQFRGRLADEANRKAFDAKHAEYRQMEADALPKPGSVYYPERQLGFAHVKTREDDAYNDHVWANIAAANMKTGDTFELNRQQQTVESISGKTLKLKDAAGKVRTYNPDGVAWAQLQRDLGGQLMQENLQAKNILKPARPLLDILKRDPAVHIDANGSVFLRDGGEVAAPQQQQDQGSDRNADTGHSAQFERYAKWIKDGKAVPPGMIEQIKTLRGLNDGEDTTLLDMLAERDKAAAPAEETPAADHPFAQRAAAILATLPNIYNDKQVKTARQALQQLAQDMGAVQHPRAGEVMAASKDMEAFKHDNNGTDGYEDIVRDVTKSLRALSREAAPTATAEATAPLPNATAPEHVQGVDDRELSEIVGEFKDAQEATREGDELVTRIFDAPAKKDVVRLEDQAKAYLWDAKEVKAYNDNLAEVAKLEEAGKKPSPKLAKAIADFEKVYQPHIAKLKAAAEKTIDGWKAHAKAQGTDPTSRSANNQRIVLSLFDLSGEWSKPWLEAGYQVYRFDIQDDPTVGNVHNFSSEFFGDWFGDFDGLDVYAILAACPCTDFASSGSRHFAAKDKDGSTVASVRLVHQTLRTIEYFKPPVWALENPVGRIEKLTGLPPWRLSFNPNHLGDPYTKKTLIWGRFNGELPIAPVEPTEGSKMHRLYGGKSQATKNARSETPEGFSYAFFMANNAIDHPAMAVANKYDRLDGKLIAQAVKAGITEEQIDSAVEDFYYQDLDDEAANDAVRELIEDAQADTQEDQAAAPVAEAPAAPVPDEGKVLLRHAGKYGKGMAEANAHTWASNQAKANPQNTYTVENAEDEFGAAKFVVVVRAKPATEAKRTTAQEQAERDAARAAHDRDEFAKQPKLWADSPFAPRIQALLDKLVAAGQEGYAKAINGGFNNDAKNKLLDEEKTAFREENVRKFLLDKGKEGQPVQPVAVEPMTTDKLAALTNVAKVLPQAIVDAAVARWNALAPALGAQGFRAYTDVHSNHAPAAQEAAQALRDILNALDGLAARRYQEAKEHKNLNPDAVKRNEQYASDVLGIDTTAHPGIDTSRQITLGGGVKEPTTPARPAITREGDDELVALAKSWGYTDDTLPKGGVGGGVPLAMPGAKVAYEFDNQRSGKEQISYTIQAVQGPNGQWGAAIKYALGGNTQDSAKGGSSLVGWDAKQYPSRLEAVQAAFDRMREAVSADLYAGKLHNSFKAYLAREAYQAKRDLLPDAKLRFAKGFATPEQELARVPLLVAVHQAQESVAKDRQKWLNKAVTALAKLPQGRLTVAGGMALKEHLDKKGKFVPSVYSQNLLSLGYLAPFTKERTAADIEAVYQRYVDFTKGKPLLTKEYFLHTLQAQDKLAKQEGLAKMRAAKAAKADEAAQQDTLQRAGQRELYGVLSHLPGIIEAAKLPTADFTRTMQSLASDWLDAQYAKVGLEDARRARLATLRQGDKMTLPQDFYDSLHKYAKRAARQAAKDAARDPAVYKEALLQATLAAKLPVEAAQVALFKDGWDHALAGKTRTTLRDSALAVQGYDAAQDWIKTEQGGAYYDGKPQKKLENTGADLRRWYEQARASMAELSADNLPDAYEAIKAQTSRVGAFAHVAGAGATPGTLRYITAVRDNVIPFQEWLLDGGALHNMNGRYSYKDSESTLMARFLAGETYPSSRGLENAALDGYAGKDATPAQRLALLQHEAARYLDKVQQLADAMHGATSVYRASQALGKLLVKDASKSQWDTFGRYTEAYQRLQSVLRRKASRYEPDTYYTTKLLENENKPDDPQQKKLPLVNPRLEQVVREGLPNHRQGKDVTPAQMKATFGFADVGFGKWVGAKQDQEHLNHAYDAFMDLATFLGQDPKIIGLGGKLHFTIGALGHGKFAAHFTYAQPGPDDSKVQVINLTNTRGDGTVAHEWFHALDHALNVGYTTEPHGNSTVETWAQHPAIKAVLNVLTRHYNLAHAQRSVLSALAGDIQLVTRGRKGKTLARDNDKAMLSNAEDVLDWHKDRSQPTDYKRAADALGVDYWGNPRELIARAAEAYVLDRMEGSNNYLVNPEWVDEGKVVPPQYKGTPYPLGEERRTFANAFDALVKALRFKDNELSVDMAVLKEGLPNARNDYNEALEAMREALPAMMENLRLQQRMAKDNAARQSAEATQRAKAQADATARQAEQARLAAALEQAPPSVPQGALSRDELEALADEAEAELTEAAQEGDAAGVGEAAAAAPAARWTQEDYRFLLNQIEKEKYVVLVADAAPGLPTIHDVAGVQHIGYGVMKVSNGDYEATFEAGGAMRQTPSGQAWTPVHIVRGREAFLQALQYDKVRSNLQAKLLPKSGPKAAPTLEAEQQKAVSAMVADVAKLGVKGIGEAFEGLYKIFGGGSGRKMSFPGGAFDQEAYKAAKPHFEASLKAFQDAGKTLKDLFKYLLQQFGPGIKPYMVQFAEDKALSAQLAAAPSATRQVADWVAARTQAGQAFTSQELFAMADRAYGGSQAKGTYSVKDAYDAMEAGVNRAILAQRITPDGSATDAAFKIERLEDLQRMLPTQTRRTQESDEFQQFSTPPALAFTAAWTANIRAGELMAEPSAGTGSLAIYGQLAGADLALNELSSRRAAVLGEVLPEARITQENAEQLHNVWPDELVPSVIVMNPPFSATAGRMVGSRDTAVGAQHIEQALKRLAPGGRLVAIVGQGMADDRPAFRAWWDGVKQAYTVRANIGIDGSNYAKYGTTFDNQLLVIDKTGPTTAPVLTGKVEYLDKLPALLEGIRNDRQEPHESRPLGQPVAAEQGGGAVTAGQAESGLGAGGADADALGAGQRAGGDAAGGAPSQQRAATPADRSDGGVGTAQRDGVPDQPGKRGGRGTAERAGSGAAAGRGGRGGAAAGEPVQRDGGHGPVASGVAVQAQDAVAAHGELTDAIFEQYAPQRLHIPGAKEHPGKLVQSAAMAAVEPPAPTYTPNLPKDVIAKGKLSLAQLEAVVYAGQAHQQFMPTGERRGFFIGDGTGVGKGREIAGIVLDNLRAGRKKAVWISEKQGLLRDAQRDMTGVMGKNDVLFAHNKTKPADAIDAKEGVLFTTYDTLRGGEKKNANEKGKTPKTRLAQIVDWLGKDYDGVIVFDESHNMANAIGKKGKRGMTKPSAKAEAGIALQTALPKARIVYVSATGATEVSNLVYAQRAGLWGEGTPFNKPQDFINNIEAGGVAAMELVSRDMKAQGSYIARSLSFDGVTYDRLEHELTPLQTDIYNELATAWQTVLQNIHTAMEETKQGRDGKAKSAALSRFWGSHQRFFNQIITSMQMPSIVEDAQAQLAQGNAVVLQLVNTNEAEQERQAAKIANDTEATFEDLDFTPRQTLLEYVQNAFPVQQYEAYTDEDEKVGYRPALDAKGNPIFNREMIALRDRLVGTLQAIRVPDNPIDMIINAFGPQMVAEVTGRSRRFVRERNAEGEYVTLEQKRPGSAAAKEAAEFMNDERQVLVFSDAGGTGYSFHADLTQKNQRHRVHYLVQPGWRANKAVQGFGRTHRTNEASQPHYVLPTTNLKAQKRFISSIARRLDQLGALTKGQRQTGSQGMFSATDNLESGYAADALTGFFMDMYHGRSALDFHDTTAALGLNGLINVETGALNQDKLPEIPQFLNRLLSLTTDMQDKVFEQFYQRLEEVIAKAKADGTFDAGVETVRALAVRKERDEVVHTDARTGAETRYVELQLTQPNDTTSFDEVRTDYPEDSPRSFVGFFRAEKSGKVFALTKTGSGMHPTEGEYVRGMRFAPSGPVRYVDNILDVQRSAEGKGQTFKREVTEKVYEAPRTGDLREPYTNTLATGATVQAELTGLQLKDAITRLGFDEVERQVQGGPKNSRNEAAVRLLARMRPLLVERTFERPQRAYTQLSFDEARAVWDAELAATPDTYEEPMHLITGVLLPIWDRFVDKPQVVRTQTDTGERLLGRVVRQHNLTQTLKNLGLNSNVAKLTPAQVLARLQAGDKAVLGNGWEIKQVTVSGDKRLEVVGNDLNYSRSAQDGMKQMGAFVERIQWQERVFLPTGEKAGAVLERLLTAKPLVDLINPKAAADQAGESDALYSRTGKPVASPADQPYTHDLFGNPVSSQAGTDSDRGPGAAAGAGQLDVDTTDAVPRGARIAPHTRVVAHATRPLGVATVTNTTEAAQAMAYLGRSPVEYFEALLTDKAGKPLAIVGAHKGSVDRTAVYQATIAAEAFRVKGAARIWFGHNHPSGDARLSNEDMLLAERLHSLFDGSGIEPMGILAVGADEDGGRAWMHSSGRSGVMPGPLPEVLRVPVLEREYDKTGRLSEIRLDSPAGAKALAREVAQGQAGVMLLDAHNRLQGFIPTPIGRPLRQSSRMGALYRALSMASASHAMIVDLHDALGEDAIRNLAGFLNNAGTGVLDVIDQNHSTWAERGQEFGGATFLARGASGRGLPVATIQQQGDRMRARWPNAPAITAVQSVAELPWKAPADTRGVLRQGTVWLVADNLPTAADVQFVVGHEVLGHAGLAAILPRAQLVNELNRLRAINPVLAVAARLQQEQFGYSAALATEEALANLAASGQQITGWQKFVHVVQQALRKVGLDMLADWLEGRTSAETMALLRSAQEAITAGPSRPAPVFSSSTDPEVLYSRSPAEVAQRAGEVIRSATVQSVKNKAIDYRGIGLQTLGRRQLTELYGYLFPQDGDRPNMMQIYNALAMRMDAEKNEAGAKADDIAVRWGKLKDHKELAELMHKATLAQVDPRQPMENYMVPAEYNVLRRAYLALSPEAQGIFGEAAAAYEQHYEDVKRAVRNRIIRALPDHPRRAELLNKMDAEMFHDIKGIYFPLARFGDYIVQVRGPDGVVEAVSFAETMKEAEALRKQLLQDYARRPDYEVLQITRRKEFNAARDSVGRGFLQQLYGVLEATGQESAELQDAISQLYLTSLPDLSWAKHGIHRKGTAGFSQNARRAFAHNMFHGARYLAKLHYVDRLTERLDDMQDYVRLHSQDADYDPVKAQQVVDEMVKRHDLYLNPNTHPLATALTSVGFMFYLGLSPASAVTNLTQTALVAYPILGGKYGFGKAGLALTKASADAVKGHNDMAQVLSGDELAAYNEWVRIGLIDVTMAHDLAGIASGEDDKLAGKLRPAMKAASYLFHHAERFNRQATALAAYRLARGQGMNHHEAMDAATEDTYAGHFDYSSGNRPRLMQGNMARVVLLFKQYAQNMIYTFAHNAALSLKGDTQAMKTLGGLLTTHALAAGALGLPLVTTLLAVASALGGDDDEPWNAKIALRNLLADTFGDKAGEVLAHGLSRLTPWDISSRVGLDHLLLPDVQEGVEGARFAEQALVGVAGPLAGMAVNLTKGGHDILAGQWQRGLEEMAPAAVRGALRSWRYATEGAQDRTGIELVPDTTPAEEAGQFLGFSPSRTREAQEGKSAIFTTDKALQSRRQELMNDFAAAAMHGEDTEAQLAAIQRFNELNPTRRIAALHLQQSIRARLQRVQQAQQGIFLPKNRQDARAAGAFANPNE